MPDSREDIARRRAARRKKIRKKRLAVGFAFFLILAIAVFAALAFTVLFPVKNVIASGSKIYSANQIIKSSGITKEDNLFVLSSETVEKTLRSKLPYIDEAVISRKLPDTVQIKVKDAKEYACYKVDGGFYAVSRNGYVLNRYDEQPQNTFEVVCSGVKCVVGQPVAFEDKVQKELVDNLLSALSKQKVEFTRIDVSDTLNICAFVSNRFTVNYGSSADLERKTAHLASMIKNMDESAKGTINLSMWTSKNPQGSFSAEK